MTSPTFPIGPAGMMAEPVVLVDPATGEPYAASGVGGGGSGFMETLWTDDTGAYFVRFDSGLSISWKDITGTTSSAPGTGARPASGANAVQDKTAYQATTGGTGYSTGDLIDHFTIVDPATGVVMGNFWLNTTTGAKLASAPSSANIKAAGGSSSVTNADLGAQADSAATTDGGTFSLIALFKRSLGYLASLVTAATDTSDVNIKAPPPGILQLNPTVSTSAYVTGNTLGGKLTLTNFGRTGILSGLLESLTIGCKVAQPFAGELWLFSADPTASTLTDHAAFVLNSADVAKVKAVVKFATTDWNVGNPGAVMDLGGLARQYSLAATSAYACIVVRGTPTFTGANDVFIEPKAMLD